MSNSDLRAVPGAGIAPLSLVCHLAAIAAVVMLPYVHWIFAPLFAVALAASWFRYQRTLRRMKGWKLARVDRSWELLTDPGAIGVHCEVTFVSRYLIGLRVRPVSGGRNHRLLLTPAGCSTDDWRKLQIFANAAGNRSVVTDDHVLGGKVDGHQDGVPRNI